MRNLTIKREKKYAACLSTMKVYIEDPAGDVTIIDTPCRMLGTLKNGEEKTFSIDNDERKVFVIVGKISKNYCNDFYRIPAGEEDVCLTGRNVLSPLAGNPFRFDGAEADETVLLNRKRNKRKGLLILIPCIIVGFILGLTLANITLFGDPDPKEFTYEDMKITLTDQFRKTSAVENFDACFESKEVAVYVEKTKIPAGAEIYSLEWFGENMLKTNQRLSSSKLQKDDGLVYYEYTYERSGDDYHYVSFLYKTSDAIWTIQFATYESYLEKYQPKFLEWAKSVEFSD